MLESIKKPFVKATAFASMLALPFLPMKTDFISSAHADEKQGTEIAQAPLVKKTSHPPAESVIPKREAWMEAGDYAKNHPVVAFAVNGHAKDATTRQIGEFIKARFAAKGVPSVYFIGKQERLGASVSFFLKDLSYGPVGVMDIPKEMETVMAHFPQAWPDYQASLKIPSAENN